MSNVDRYIDAIDTIYPDGYARESLFRSAGDMLEPAPRMESGGWLARLMHRIATWQTRRHTRAGLRELTDEQLHDIGITKGEARSEISKSWFWD